VLLDDDEEEARRSANLLLPYVLELWGVLVTSKAPTGRSEEAAVMQRTREVRAVFIIATFVCTTMEPITATYERRFESRHDLDKLEITSDLATPSDSPCSDERDQVRVFVSRCC
jgi:hypothetical protein